MAARKESRLKTQHRDAIKTSMIRKRLEDHIVGKVELSASQVTAALGLLRKTIPDLKAIEHSGEVEHRRVNELTNDELERIATSGSAGASESQKGQRQPSQVH